MLTETQTRDFAAHGYLVLNRILPDDVLTALQQVCEARLALQTADMDRVGASTLGLSQRDRRYFLAHPYEDSPELATFLLGDVAAGIVGPLLGGNALLFLQLFIVKSAHTGSAFAWHQDSGYLLGNPHKAYVTLWCALDDMSADNGALHVMPYDRAATTDVVVHRKDRASGDLVGHPGDDPGLLLEVARGSIVVLASNTFHRTGPNSTDKPRRALAVSYSSEPITDQSGRMWNLAVPLLQDGRRVS